MKTIIDFVTENSGALLLLLGFVVNTAATYLLKSVQSRRAVIVILKAIVGALEKSTPAAVLLLAFGLQGCAGTFDESRLAHHATRRVAPVQISSSPRCIQLSDRARWEGALAKGGAVLTGASGLASIPFDGKGERIAIVGSTVLLAAGTAVVVFLSESDAAAYIAEGCAQ